MDAAPIGGLTLKSAVTTLITDTTTGRPVGGVLVSLEHEQNPGNWKSLGGGRTNDDGRHGGLCPPDTRLVRGLYRLTFEVASYFRRQNVNAFYPYITIVFEVRDPEAHYHVPLLLSPFGYSTHRGS